MAKLKMKDVRYFKGTIYDFGEYKTVWGADIYIDGNISPTRIAIHCRTKSEAISEARKYINYVNNKMLKTI